MVFRRLFAMLVSCLAFQALAQSLSSVGEQVQLGRYSTQPGTPDEVLLDPLSVYAHLTYPRQTVATVGDAMNYTLLRTGFRMVPESALDQAAQRFLALPLPESQRRLGPFRVVDLLKTLLGSAWQLHNDPVTRQVWFTAHGKPVTVAVQPASIPAQASVPPPGPIPADLMPPPNSSQVEAFKHTQRKAAVAPPTTAPSAPVWALGDAKDLKTLITTWAKQDGRAVTWTVPDSYPVAGRLAPGWAYQGEFKTALGKLAASYGAFDTPFSLSFSGRDLVVKPVEQPKQ